MTKVRELVLTRASPSNIGPSSVGGSLFCPVWITSTASTSRLAKAKAC